jgi:hypothetical protein
VLEAALLRVDRLAPGEHRCVLGEAMRCRASLLAVRLVALAVLVMAGCSEGRRDMAIGAAAVDGNRIAVQGSCHEGRRLDAVETEDRIELRFSVASVTGGDCFDCVLAALDAPVGDRELIDVTTRDEISVDADDTLHDCFEPS